MQTQAVFSDADLDYIRRNFVTGHQPCAGAPGPSYVLEDGTAYYPANYTSLECDEECFKRRLEAACTAESIPSLDAAQEWESYMQGTYGVCLRDATPENIARKAALIARIDALTAEPREHDADWVQQLRQAVDALDALEMPFSPDYDRVRFGRPPTRDSHITAVRIRYPQIAVG
ncbi:MAG TPA: DUF6058 family natural product biosynthesis protein [Candidatus Baltobacteraceae bacterium]|nr:DUF6058 family natural product biosynthesis protein [Candidatus Baltobacteraceae bacterium]